MSGTPEVVFVGQPLPAAAVQALYHAATGKTENLTKFLRKNYIIHRNDLDQLYLKLRQKLEHYEVVGGPTVTINVTLENKEYQQFSSWERFDIFDIGKAEIVESKIYCRYRYGFASKIKERRQLDTYAANRSNNK